MQYKEDLLNKFLTGNLSLSQIDYRFFNNLQIAINKGTGITTNQASLFDKLINKYSRQLRKNDIDIDKSLQLSWNTKILPSEREFTSARITVENNDTLVLKVPFNNKFIRAVNQNPNSMKYNKERRAYTATFTTRNLKNMLDMVNKHFTSLQLSDEISNILADLKQYEALFYDPTLVEINGRLVIVAVNQALGKHLENITIEKTSECLEKLLDYGIIIDKSVWGDDEKLKFAGSRVYELNNSNLNKVVEYLTDLKYDGYVIPRSSDRLKISSSLVNQIEASNPNLVSFNATWEKATDSTKLVIFLHNERIAQSFIDQSNAFKKIIIMKDSTKVDIK